MFCYQLAMYQVSCFYHKMHDSSQNCYISAPLFRGSSESTLVEMSNCWKSHATAQLIVTDFINFSFQELMVQVCHFTYFLSYYNICFVIPDEGRDIVLTSSARPSVHIVCLS